MIPLSDHHTSRVVLSKNQKLFSTSMFNICFRKILLIAQKNTLTVSAIIQPFNFMSPRN